VRERIPTTGADAETGMVIDTYKLGVDYRCVVQCVSGREAVFFEHELIVDARELSTAGGISLVVL
jgi:hypothetical protein